jgi:hypothetical protein
MRGFGLLSLLSLLLFAAVATVSFGFITNKLHLTTQTAGSGGNQLPTNLALNAHDQANLRSLQTALAVYFAQYETYPTILEELNQDSYSQVDVSKYNYTLCDSTTIVVTTSSGAGFKASFNETVYFTEKNPLKC